MYKYLIYFGSAALISFAITPLVRRLALKLKVLDLPSARKVHLKPMPLLGGIPIFLALNLTILGGALLKNADILGFLNSRWPFLLVCQVVILILGIYDDVRHLQPLTKLLFQIGTGMLLVISGFGIHSISNPFTGNIIDLGWFSIPLTIIWLVVITNALNLVDGLDGLAAGTSFIVCITLFAVAFLQQSTGASLAAIILAGSIVGFLRFNFHPAKIFLGDSGSLLLGFLLAFLSIKTSSKGATMVAVLAPILALGLPIMDTLIAVIRRFLKSINVLDIPKEGDRLKVVFLKRFSLFEADKSHVHHKLLEKGISHRNVVILLYGLCIVLCALAVFSVALDNLNTTLFVGVIAFAFLIGLKSLGYQEFKVLEKGLLLPIFHIPVVNKRFFLGFYDIFAISLAYYFSFLLVFHGFENPAKNIFLHTLPMVLALKIIVLYISGIYRISLTYSSLEDLVKIVESVVVASGGGFFLLVALFGMKAFGGFVFFVLDFYLTLSIVGGGRMSYMIVRTFYKKGSGAGGKNVIIYGAGHQGSLVMNELRHNGSVYSPIGFIDDDRRKKGKKLNNFPILGSIEELDQLVEKNNISEVIISSGKITQDRLSRLKNICGRHGIALRQFEYRFYEFA